MFYNQVCGPRFTRIEEEVKDTNAKVSDMHATLSNGLKDKVAVLGKAVTRLMWMIGVSLMALIGNLILRLLEVI